MLLSDDELIFESLVLLRGDVLLRSHSELLWRSVCWLKLIDLDFELMAL